MDDEAETLAASVAARIGCIQAAVDKLQRRLPATNVWVSSAGGEGGVGRSAWPVGGAAADIGAYSPLNLRSSGIPDQCHAPQSSGSRRGSQAIALGGLRVLKAAWKNPGGVGIHGMRGPFHLGVLPNVRAGAQVNEDDAVEALLTAHADMARLTVELADARERRAPRRVSLSSWGAEPRGSPRDWV